MELKEIKNTLYKYFKIWWIPIIFHFVAIGIFFLGTIFRRDWIIDFSLMVFFINIIGTIVSSIVQIVNRKWYFIFPQLGLTVFLFYYVSMIFMYSPPDYYGANKKIPKNIEIYEPIETEPTKNELDKFDLVLSSSFQPGIYIYYTDYKTTEIGSFYIKAFELTSNDHLSAERMKIESKVKVENLEPKLYLGEFLIYEGSWGDKYGARIELWFESSNGNKDFKITERNYVVEGWMR